MQKTCILFSGQGSQYEGMGAEIFAANENNKAICEIYEVGSDVLGFDLKETCFHANAQTLAKTEISQPAIFATSLVCFEAVKALGVTASCVCGHSLGEYAAMVASEMVSLKTGFEIIKKRSIAMGKCAQNQDGAMCAIMGATNEEIVEVCNNVEGYVTPVNFNSLAQTVIAGESKAIEQAIEIFTNQGKRAVKLAVAAAFHSKLMQPAAEEFYAGIKDISFAKPSIDFYCNITGDKLQNADDMAIYLRNHLVSPVQFVKELQNIQNAGITQFVECGPNKVLTGLVRKTLTDVSQYNVENIKTLDKLKDALAV